MCCLTHLTLRCGLLQSFDENDIEWEHVCEADTQPTDAQLKEIGVASMGARLSICAAMGRLCHGPLQGGSEHPE